MQPDITTFPNLAHTFESMNMEQVCFRDIENKPSLNR